MARKGRGFPEHGITIIKPPLGGGNNNYTKNLSDTFSLAELILKQPKKIALESFTLSELFSKGPNKLLPNTGIVGSASASSASNGTSLSINYSPQMGNSLVVCVWALIPNSAATISSVMLSNSSSVNVDESGIGNSGGIYYPYWIGSYSNVPSGITSITANANFTGVISIILLEIASSSITATAGGGTYNSGTSTNWSSNSYNVSASPSLMLALVAQANNNLDAAIVSSPNFLIGSTSANGFPPPSAQTVSLVGSIFTNGGTHQITGTFTNSDTYYAVGVVYKGINVDSLVPLDTFTKGPLKLPVDAYSLADNFSLGLSKYYTDTLFLSEVVTKCPAKYISEIFTLLDSLSYQWVLNRTYTDSFSLVELFSKAIGKNPSEAFAIIDTLIYALNRLYTDSFSIVESLSKGPNKLLVDVFTLLDILGYQWVLSRTYADSFSIIDSLSKTPNKRALDTFNLIDTLTWITSISLLDTYSIIDLLSKASSKTALDSFSIVDNFSRQWILSRVYTDSFSITDTASIVRSKGFVDSLSLNDTVTKLVSKLQIDSYTLIDTLLKTTGWIALDVFTLSDIVSVVRSKGFVDTFSLVELFNISFGRSYMDSFTLVDNLTKASNKQVIDTLTLVDSFGRTEYWTATDTFTLTETFNKYSKKSYADNLSIIESFSKAYGKNVLDVITLIDTFFTGGHNTINVSDTFTVNDQIAFVWVAQRLLVDTYTIMESFQTSKGGELSITDILTLIDIASYMVSHLLVDTISLQDSLNVGKATGELFSDALPITDAITKNIALPVIDNIALSEFVSKLLHVSVQDTVSITEQFSTSSNTKAIVAVDTFLLLDTITLAFHTGAINVFDYINILEQFAIGRILPTQGLINLARLVYPTVYNAKLIISELIETATLVQKDYEANIIKPTMYGAKIINTSDNDAQEIT